MKHDVPPPKPALQRLIALQSLLAQFAAIERSIHVPPSFRHENDTEHCYNLAITAWFLSASFPELDRDQLIRFALAHDLVEVHAGDTNVFGSPADLASKHERETAALHRLEAEWADFPNMLETIRMYEHKETAEAKFIYALDKIMPVMMIFIGNGHTWQLEGITHQQLHEAKQHKVALSPGINEYYQQLHELLLENAHFFAKAGEQV